MPPSVPCMLGASSLSCPKRRGTLYRQMPSLIGWLPYQAAPEETGVHKLQCGQGGRQNWRPRPEAPSALAVLTAPAYVPAAIRFAAAPTNKAPAEAAAEGIAEGTYAGRVKKAKVEGALCWQSCPCCAARGKDTLWCSSRHQNSIHCIRADVAPAAGLCRSCCPC